MPTYKDLYFKAFNAMTDAEKLIEQAAVMIRAAQQSCEEQIVENDDASPPSLM